MNYLFKKNERPFFSIGAQTSNSSSAQAELVARDCRAAQKMGMNTLAAAVTWELLEPNEGVYSFDQIDMLIRTTEEYGLCLVVLWFGTWKNGNSHYVPGWLKKDRKRFCWAVTADGTPVRTLSPHCEATWQADKTAFLALCRHITETDIKGTVIAIQIENEPGLIGTMRDYSENATALYNAPVPSEVEALMKKSGTWEDVYGFYAPEYFTAYHIARYIDGIALAAREVTALPFYVNTWLQEMHNQVPGIDYPSGGPVSRTFPLFKMATPHIEALAPDIYLQEFQTVEALHQTYSSMGNPYYLPETLFSGLAMVNAIRGIVKYGLCGVHVFGIDMVIDEQENIRPVAQGAVAGAKILSAMRPLIEKDQGSPRLFAVGQYDGASEQYIDFGNYIGSVRFKKDLGDWMKKPGSGLDALLGKPAPIRGMGLIWYNGTNEFYMAGTGWRLMLFPKTNSIRTTNATHSDDFLNQRSQAFLTVEEGVFDEDGVFCPNFRRNGDEADYGFGVELTNGVLHVVMDETF